MRDDCQMARRPARPLKAGELTAGAMTLRAVLEALPAAEDGARDAVVRRRVEGAIVAAELAAGEPSPRMATPDKRDEPGS